MFVFFALPSAAAAGPCGPVRIGNDFLENHGWLMMSLWSSPGLGTYSILLSVLFKRQNHKFSLKGKLIIKQPPLSMVNGHQWLSMVPLSFLEL